MITYILFVVGFVLLIKGADLLVDGSSSIAKKRNISDLVIGLTIVAFGTSAPELFVNISASLDGNADIAIGNILGSNIANIFLILGISALVRKLTVQSSTIWKEIPFSLLAVVVVGFMANDVLIDGQANSFLSRIDGLILICFFIIFMYYIVEISKKSNTQNDESIKTMSTLKSTIYIVLGLVGLVIGGQWIVDGATEIATGLGVSQSLIGLTVVAIGTSLPEMATSVVAAYKGKSDIAIGNVVGSNIFNIFWILGLSAFIKPLPFKLSSNVDILMATLASLFLFLFLFIGEKHKLQKWQGVMFILIYVAYLSYLVAVDVT
jgi:cation:H+ antiporter